MTLKTKRETTEESMTRSSPWRIDINFSPRRKLDQRWRVEPVSTEVWMRSLIAESKPKTSSICSLKSPDKTWNSKMNSRDQREFWMRNSLRLVNSETKVTLKETRSLISDPRLLNSKETSILLSLKEPTCSEKSLDLETSRT